VTKQQRGGRPVYHPRLGALLRDLREAKGWSVQQAVNAAAGKGHTALTWNSLTWLEAGKTKLPDAEVLKAVADIYELRYAELARGFVSEIEQAYGRADADSSTLILSSKESAGATQRAADQARIRQLESRVQELEIYRIIVERLRPVLAHALALVGSGAEPDQAADRRPARVRRDRKTD
jgi:transcriptional regulator with XRE-family HTH domain